MTLIFQCKRTLDALKTTYPLVYLYAAKMATGGSFLKWLNNKLRELKTDENVYGSYIIGILDGEESIEEKKEALEEILSQIIVSI